MFSELGYKLATLEDVASTLCMTRPALYHYAKSKDELLSDCIDLARLQLDEAVADARKAKDGLAQLKQFFRRYAEIVCDDFGKCFVLISRSEMSSEEAEKNRVVQSSLSGAVTAMIRIGIRDESIRDCDALDVSRMLFAMFNGIPKWKTPHHKRGPAAIADDFMALFEVGIKKN